jgi:hypothetical protein
MMFGKRRIKELCPSCDAAIHEGQKVCRCGTATHYMDFSERTAWEVEQWRSYRQGLAQAG